MPFKMLGGSLAPLSEAHPDFDKVASGSDLKASEIASRSPMDALDVETALGETPSVAKGAKYKIEVAYMEARKLKEPSACSVTVWESGRRFHGGGDQSMFWCINAKNPDEGCGGLIPDNMVKNGVALCPHCKRSVNQQLLPVTRVGIFSPQNLAKEIHKIFRHLGSDADVYLKYHRSDMEARARLKSEGGAKKEVAIYTVTSIIRDSLLGGDLTRKFEDFLTA
jgi:hypothetical protein